MKVEGLPQEIAEVVAGLKASGYSKVSVVFCEKNGFYKFPCMACSKILDSVRGIHVFVPYKADERAYIYFTCDECRVKLTPKDYEEIQDRLIIARGIAKKLD